jgi:hypothetical protein
MGRGLSELQRYMLRRAAELGKASRVDVLIGHFGWQPRRMVYRPGLAWGKMFSPRRIGEKKYRSDQASLSRAWQRLVRRGLLKESGVLILTAEGRDLVRSWGVEPGEPPESKSPEERAAAINGAIG